MDITSPVTGMAQPDLTSPTYTLAADTAPNPNGKQWYVSALGGTQSGVTTHSLSFPFTVSIFRPSTFKTLSQGIMAMLGLVDAPRNVYKIIVRKGSSINNLGGSAVNLLRIEYEIAANAPDMANGPEQIQAMFSLAGGVLVQLAPGFSNQVKSGSL